MFNVHVCRRVAHALLDSVFFTSRLTSGATLTVSDVDVVNLGALDGLEESPSLSDEDEPYPAAIRSIVTM